MAKMKKCPVCGSEHIMIDGVEQVKKKKGLMYYLSGAAAYDLGEKHGSKLGKVFKGKDSVPNAECLDCHHKWVE